MTALPSPGANIQSYASRHPPVNGKANIHLVAFLSECFGVSKNAVIIEKGRTGPLKQVRIVRPMQLPLEIRR